MPLVSYALGVSCADVVLMVAMIVWRRAEVYTWDHGLLLFTCTIIKRNDIYILESFLC